MSFVVEDGTAKDDANSLVDVSYADSYCSERGLTTWAGTNEVKQQALIRATDYLELRYSTRFLGQTNTLTQALSFPRDGATSVPTRIKNAVVQYAIRALKAGLMPDPAQSATGGNVVSKETTVGPVTTKVAYSADEPKAFQSYPEADSLVRTFLRPSGGIYR